MNPHRTSERAPADGAHATPSGGPAGAAPGATPPAPTPARVETSRGPVEYVDVGEGPVLLALHGAMGGWDQSLLLTRTVTGSGYRTLALSRPGYLGTALEAAPGPEAQADLYAEILDRLGIDRVCAMAVSGGGPSAIHFALRHPDRCWGLALFSTCSSPVTERLPFAFHVMRLFGRTRWFARSMERKHACLVSEGT